MHNDGAVVERPYAVADLGCGLPPVNVNLDCGGYVVEHVENAGLGVYVNIEGVVGRLEAGGADMGPVITKARKVNEVASEVKVRRYGGSAHFHAYLLHTHMPVQRYLPPS